MSRLRFKISMSLDGFVAGSPPEREEPARDRRRASSRVGLPACGVSCAPWSRRRGGQRKYPVAEESLANIRATVMGRNMFGGHPGPWDAQNPWKGWWGVNPPFHHSVFVLTHHAREPLELEGGTTFTFVTDGIHAALERARQAAGGKDVSLAGGADVDPTATPCWSRTATSHPTTTSLI
jgi:hypothetical protein